MGQEFKETEYPHLSALAFSHFSVESQRNNISFSMVAANTKSPESLNLGRLKSLGISTPEFVPFLLPKKYLDLRPDQLKTVFSDLPEGEKCIVYGELTEFEVHRNTVPSRTVAKLVDVFGNEVSATFFGDPRLYVPELEDHLYCKLCLAGSIGYFKQFAQLRNPAVISSDFHVIGVQMSNKGETRSRFTMIRVPNSRHQNQAS